VLILGGVFFAERAHERPGQNRPAWWRDRKAPPVAVLAREIALQVFKQVDAARRRDPNPALGVRPVSMATFDTVTRFSGFSYLAEGARLTVQTGVFGYAVDILIGRVTASILQ